MKWYHTIVLTCWCIHVNTDSVSVGQLDKKKKTQPFKGSRKSEWLFSAVLFLYFLLCEYCSIFVLKMIFNVEFGGCPTSVPKLI